MIELSLGEYGIPVNTAVELAGEQNKNDLLLISKKRSTYIIVTSYTGPRVQIMCPPQIANTISVYVQT